MIVLVADGILIVMLIMIGKLTEAIALTTSKKKAAIYKITEGRDGMVGTEEDVIQ